MNAPMQEEDFLDTELMRQTRGIRSGTFVKLLAYAKPYKYSMLGSLTLLTLGSTAVVFSARFLGRLIQTNLVEHQLGSLWTNTGLLIAAEFFSLLTAYWGRRLLSASASFALFDIRKTLFKKLAELPMTYFDTQPLGKTVTRITYDVEGLEDFFSGTFARMVSSVITLVVVIVTMLLVSPKLGLLLVATMIPAIAVTYLTRTPLIYWNREFAKRNSSINARLSEYINGLPVIRSFGAEKWSLQSFDETVDSHLESAIRINVLNAWVRPAIILLCNIPMLTLLFLSQTMSLGLLVAFIRYCERFSRPVAAISQEIHTIQTALTNMERVVFFLDRDTEDRVLGANGQRSAHDIQGNIAFDRVSLTYERGTRKALDDVSFEIQVGQKIGLAGQTGSGKTSTVSLLARLYEFQEGHVRLDGVSIREFDRQSLREKIGFVSQDVVIFKGTVRDNLLCGLDLTDEQIEKSCRQTGLWDLLKSSGRDLSSSILEQGANLSIGERQLLSITRVLLRDPAILVLDEATSNIDPSTEKLIQSAVHQVMRGRTTLVIAHRLSTLRECDRLLVFRDGKLVEHGTFETLLAQRGYYYDLIRSGETPDAESSVHV